MRRLLLPFLLISVSLFAFALVKQYKNDTQLAFAKEIIICNGVPKEFRFSCYRASIEKFYGKKQFKSTKELKRQILSNSSLNFHSGDSSYAIFGTNCHTFYHALGDFIATYSDISDLENQLNQGPSDCTAGFTMGLYKRMALKNKFQTDLLKKFYKICKKDQENQCAHEVGHLLHDKYTSAVLKVLDNISLKEYDLKPHENYQYTTFDKVDLNTPFEECEDIFSDNNNLVAQCYTGVGHNLFLFGEFSPDGYKQQFKQCTSVADENKENCYGFLAYRIGINDAATKFLAGKPQEGIKVCKDVVDLTGTRGMKKHCYLGVGGGIGLFLDSEFANTKIIGENISQIQKTVVEHINMCDQAEEEFKEECYKGLLGTKLKKLYKDLNLQNAVIEKILPKSNDAFQVVG